MPRIKESTVKEHREKMMQSIFDAAEAILREEGPEGLTAAAVTKEVGIARNSLYRYVDSIDALRAQVVGTYLPEWTNGIATAMQAAPSAHERIIAYTRENLRLASERGHIWMVNAAKGLSPELLMDIMGAHGSVEKLLVDACAEVQPAQPDIFATFVNAVTNNGLTLIDGGTDPDIVITEATKAVRAMTSSV